MTVPSDARLHVSPLNKGIGNLLHPVTAKEIEGLGWNLLLEDVSLPAAVLYRDKLQHNAEWMQEFVQAYGLNLAPHGKTTMAPWLFDLQLRTGAWGITLATAQQTRVAYTHGVRRVLMANQLVGKANMAIISDLVKDEEFEYFCLVDSAAQVEQLEAFFSACDQRIQVLIEVGIAGGRCGVRNQQQLEALLDALSRSKHILLCGIEVYEGVLKDEATIRSFLESAVLLMQEMQRQNRFARQPPLLSGAGSAWYDIVAEVFSGAGRLSPVEVILRPGCYLTHDVGIYQEAQAQIQQRNPVAQKMRAGLVPALHVWAYIQSVPEDGLAIVALGKRDVAFDAGLPVPKLHFRPGDRGPNPAPAHWRLTKMMDQHAYLAIGGQEEVRAGDMVAFDISHPCLTFDKWRYLLLLDADYSVTGIVETYF